MLFQGSIGPLGNLGAERRVLLWANGAVPMLPHFWCHTPGGAVLANPALDAPHTDGEHGN